MLRTAGYVRCVVISKRMPPRRLPASSGMPLLGPLDPSQILSGAQRVWRLTTRRVRPDHQAIVCRDVRFVPQSMVRMYFYITVAPSRWAARPFDDGQVRRASTFARDVLPGVFGDVPTSADQNVTVFATEGNDGYREHQLLVHPTGLVEVLWMLSPGRDLDHIWLDGCELASIVRQLAAAVGRHPYSELSRAGRGHRRFARVDWGFNLATGITEGGGHRPWKGIRFAGETPPRAQHDWPAAPPDGYVQMRLRNSRRRRDPAEVAEVFLTELAAANGYYEFALAVHKTATLGALPAATDAAALPALRDPPALASPVEHSKTVP